MMIVPKYLGKKETNLKSLLYIHLKPQYWKSFVHMSLLKH